MNNTILSTLKSIFENLVELGIEDFLNSSDLYIWLSYKDVKDFISKNKIDCYTGSSKACFVIDGLDWVIKIPFTGRYSEYDDYEPMRNYCELELANYIKAKQNNLEKFFCETEFLEEYLNVKSYIQKRVDCDECSLESIVFDDVLKSSDKYDDESDDDFNCRLWEEVDNYTDSDKIWAIYSETYAVSEIQTLLRFLVENDINDLHYGNFGYDEYDQIIIIDFSGYSKRY